MAVFLQRHKRLGIGALAALWTVLGWATSTVLVASASAEDDGAPPLLSGSEESSAPDRGRDLSPLYVFEGSANEEHYPKSHRERPHQQQQRLSEKFEELAKFEEKASRSTQSSSPPPTDYYTENGGLSGVFVYQNSVLVFIETNGGLATRTNGGVGVRSGDGGNGEDDDSEDDESNENVVDFDTYQVRSEDPQRPGNYDDDDDVFIEYDCTRYLGWENPPPYCQTGDVSSPWFPDFPPSTPVAPPTPDEDDDDDDDEGAAEGSAPTIVDTADDDIIAGFVNETASSGQTLPPVQETRPQDEIEDSNGDLNTQDGAVSSNLPLNVITVQLSVAMGRRPTDFDPLNDVVSRVVTDVIDTLTPFFAFYFGVVSKAPWEERRQRILGHDWAANNHQDATTHRGLWSIVPAHGARRRAEDESDDKPDRAPIDLLHAFTSLEESTPHTSSSASSPSTIYWYDTKVHFAAYFRPSPGSDDRPTPIFHRNHIGNITYICQSKVNQTISNGVMIDLLDGAVHLALEENQQDGQDNASSPTSSFEYDEDLQEQLSLLGVATLGESGRGQATYVLDYRKGSWSYHQPLEPSFGVREWVGLSMFVITLLVVGTLYRVSSYYQSRRAKLNVWGAALTEEGISNVLQVGWKYKAGSPEGEAASPQLFLQVFEKSRGRYTNDEDSLLKGGVEHEDMLSYVSGSSSQIHGKHRPLTTTATLTQDLNSSSDPSSFHHDVSSSSGPIDLPRTTETTSSLPSLPTPDIVTNCGHSVGAPSSLTSADTRSDVLTIPIERPSKTKQITKKKIHVNSDEARRKKKSNPNPGAARP